jgi:taurine dioxygenase
VPLNPNVSLISNLDEDGNPVKHNGGLGSYEVVWHSDNSYVAVPPAGSMLYAVVLPTDGGGDTWFNNQYRAYDELPAELKQAIAGRMQRHDASRNSAGVLRPTVKLPTTPEEVPGPAHPLVRMHPVSGRRALYLGRRRDWPSNYILGMSNEESEALLDKLWTHATQEKYAWKHVWRLGDLVLWDNRCAMHYRSEIDATQARVMYRTVIDGEAVIAG